MGARVQGRGAGSGSLVPRHVMLPQRQQIPRNRRSELRSGWGAGWEKVSRFLESMHSKSAHEPLPDELQSKRLLHEEDLEVLHIIDTRTS